MEDIVEEGLLLKCVQACSNNGFCIFNVSFRYLQIMMLFALLFEVWFFFIHVFVI